MNDLIIKPSTTLRESMKQMAKVGERCLLVVDDSNSLIGTITDGDLRRAILSGAGFKTHAISMCQKNPTVFFKGKVDIELAKKIFLNQRFDLIPVVDNSRKLADVLFFRSDIMHGVERFHLNKGERRISISFNIDLKGIGSAMRKTLKK